jgi:hypothetical protein
LKPGGATHLLDSSFDVGFGKFLRSLGYELTNENYGQKKQEETLLHALPPIVWKVGPAPHGINRRYHEKIVSDCSGEGISENLL